MTTRPHTAKSRRLPQLACAVSLLALCAPASAATITYATGSTNAAPIVLTDNSTILQVLGTGPATQSGDISGAFGLTKTGGTLILTGNNTYTGTTTVQDGIWQIGQNPGVAPPGNFVLSSTSSSLVIARNSLTYTGSISGAGSLTISSGATGLEGANTYTGGTTVASNATLFLGGHNGSTGSVTGDIALSGTLSLNKTGTQTFSNNVIGGASSTLNQFNGTEIATGNISVPNITVQNSSTLQIGNGVSGALTQPATIVFSNGGNLILNSSTASTIAISGNGTLRQSGSGTATLTNTSFGATLGITIDAGATLQIAPASGVSPITIPNVVTDNGTLVLNPASAATQVNFAGTASGTGSLVKAGSGTVVLTNTNTYTGGTTIQDGILQIGNGGSVGSIVGNVTLTSSSANLVFARSNTTFGGTISGTGSVAASAGTTVLTADNTYTGGTTVASTGSLQLGGGGATGSVTGDIALAGILTLDRSGTQIFSNNVTGNGTLRQVLGTEIATGNISTFGVTVQNSTLQIGNGTSGSLQSAVTLSNGTLILNIPTASTISLAGNGTLRQSGSGLVTLADLQSNPSIIIDAGTTLQIAPTSTTASIPISSTITDNGTLVLNEANPGSTIIFNNAASGTGNLVKTGSGVLLLTGTNTYTGLTTVQAGTLQIGSVNNGSIVGDVVLSGSGSSLVFGRNSYTYGGKISGIGSMTAANAIALTLTGDSTYTGGTTVTGILQLGNGGTTGSVAGDITLAGTLNLGRSGTQTFSNNVIGGSSSTLRQILGTEIATGNISVSSTTIQNSTLQIGNGVSGSLQSSVVTLSNGTLVFNSPNASSFSVQGGGTVRQSGSGIATITNNIVPSGPALIVDAGTTLQIAPGGTANQVFNNQITDNGTLLLNATTSFIELGAFGSVSGSGNIVKMGSGSAQLTGQKTYTGTTSVNQGTLILEGPATWDATLLSVAQGATLQIGDGNAPATLVGNINIAGTLAFGNNIAYGGVISGTGNVSAVGSQLLLTGNNTYTGANIVNSGKTLILAGNNAASSTTLAASGHIQVGVGGTAGTLNSDVSVGSNGTVDFNRSDTYTYANAVSGDGILRQLGTGSLILTGNNSNTGSTVVNSGTIQVGNGGTTGTLGSGTITNNGTLAFNRSNTVSASDINGGGSLIQRGSGTLILTGTNNQASTTVQSGALMVGTASQTAGLIGPVTIASGARLAGYGGISGAVSNNGNVTPGDAGAIGTLFISSYAQSGTGTLTMDITPISADSLQVGTASLGGTLAIQAAPGNYENSVVTLITGNSITGSFANVTGIPAGGAYSLQNTGTQINLVLAGTANLNLYSAFNRNAYVMEQDASDGLFTDAAARACNTGQKKPCPELSIWYRGEAGVGDFDATSTTRAFGTRHAGFAVGADYNSDEGYQGGISAAYTRGALNLGGSESRVLSDSLTFAATGALPVLSGEVSAAALYLIADGDARRRVTTSSGTTSTATSHPKYNMFGVAVQYRQQVLLPALTAHARVGYAQLSEDGFAETGAAPFNFSVAGSSTSGVYGDVGLRLAPTYTMRSGTLLIPEVTTSVRIPLRSPDLAVTSQLTSSTTLAAPHQDASFLLGLGVSARKRNGDSFYLRIDGRISGGEREGSLMMGASVRL